MGCGVKNIILGLVLAFSCGSAIAQTEEAEFLDQIKATACSGDKKCESYFSTAIGISAMISRYHGECMIDNDTSKQCKDAEMTYKHIEAEYERDKKLKK